jgi:hypothetical protein
MKRQASRTHLPSKEGRISAALAQITRLSVHGSVNHSATQTEIPILPPSAATTAARVTSAVATMSPAWAASASAATAIAIATSAGTAFTRAGAFRSSAASIDRRHDAIHAIEIRLIVGIEICATFDHSRGRALWCAMRGALRNYWCGRCTSSVVAFRQRSSAHFCALLF